LQPQITEKLASVQDPLTCWLAWREPGCPWIDLRSMGWNRAADPL